MFTTQSIFLLPCLLTCTTLGQLFPSRDDRNNSRNWQQSNYNGYDNPLRDFDNGYQATPSDAYMPSGGIVPSSKIVNNPYASSSSGNYYNQQNTNIGQVSSISASDAGYNQHQGQTSGLAPGSFCWSPIFTCKTPDTILYCINRQCVCPTAADGWTLAPGNLPLDTVWYATLNKCISVAGSSCHTNPTPGTGSVYCFPGSECVPLPGQNSVGTCSGTSHFFNMAQQTSAVFLTFVSILSVHTFL